MSIKDFKRYKCDECDKNFTLNIELKAYIAAAHDKIFNCDQCGKNLATRSACYKPYISLQLFRFLTTLLNEVRPNLDFFFKIGHFN